MGKGVEVSNSGQFVATIILWPVDADSTNPTLIPGTHELNVEDNDELRGRHQPDHRRADDHGVSGRRRAAGLHHRHRCRTGPWTTWITR